MESLNYSKELACSELKQLVSDWINAKENRNVSSLARGAGVSENCIRRVLNNNSLPVTENLQKIIVFINSGTSNLNLLSVLPGNLSNHFKFQLSYLNFKELKSYTQMSDVEHLLVDFPHKVIFERSCISEGISVEEIKNMFGQKGEIAALELVNNGIVVQNDKFYKSVEKYKNHSFSQSFYKTYVSETIKEFYKSQSQFNFIYNVTEGVSVKGYSKVMDILEAASAEIQKVTIEMPGEIPLTAGVFMDTLTYKSCFDDKNEVEK